MVDISIKHRRQPCRRRSTESQKIVRVQLQIRIFISVAYQNLLLRKVS
jgi:hypothetical protein